MKEMQKDNKRISVRKEDERRAEKVGNDVQLLNTIFSPSDL